MTPEQGTKLVEALTALLWAALAGWLLFMLRASLARLPDRISGVELFGVKLSISGGQALDAAIDMARKNPGWNVDVPEAARTRALQRARDQRALLDGAEILWVDDRPTNNRNETRMLRSFGALITCACTTDEAVAAVALAAEELRPFHLILSDISREFPTHDSKAGLAMLDRLRNEKSAVPVIFYIGRRDADAAAPPGAFGLTDRPDQLLHLALDALARVRGTT
jgi:CheY-like chemotaxis protein